MAITPHGPARGFDPATPGSLELSPIDSAGVRTRSVIQSFGHTLRQGQIDGRMPDTAGTVAAAAAPAIVDLLTAHPIVADRDYQVEFADIFGTAREKRTDIALVDALDVLTRSAIALGLAGTEDDGVIDAALATALGVDPASIALRKRLLATPTVERDPTALPTFHGATIDSNRLQQIVVWGTVRDMIRAFARAGNAFAQYAGWAGRATANANGITGLDPDHGCAGETVTIQGNGFGDTPPANTTVRFPTTNGGCRDVDATWSAEGIRVVVPDDAGIGCVGFLVTDGTAPSDPFGAQNDLASAAGMYQSVLGDAFGRVGVMFGQVVINVVSGIAGVSSLPCPPCLPADANGHIPNRFVGGPPHIRSFTTNGRQTSTLRPGDSVTLAWDIEAAETVTITRQIVGTSPWPDPPSVDALPSVTLPTPTPAAGSVGPFPVPWDGYDDWDADYVLSATNPCGVATESVRIEMREQPPLLWGLADTHVHFIAHLAHGGYGVWGAPHASDPSLVGDLALADALPWCSGPHGHGVGGVLPSLEGVGGHLVGGFNEFDGWPAHTTLAHQQTYIDWIKRAVDGGLRLVVCFAVNNELLAESMTALYGPYLSTDDTSAIARQLDAIDAMVKFVDDQTPGGQGWMEVAKTPVDARRIIAAGRLAIVKGVEVDSLGGWRTPAALETDAASQGKSAAEVVADVVQGLYDKGVRHIFPVHGTNNAFGGPALFVKNYDAATYHTTGQSFEVESANPALGISYRIDEDDFDGGTVAEVLGYYGLQAAMAVGGAALTGLTLGGFIGGSVGAVGLGVAGAALAASQYPTPPNKPASWSLPGGHINAQGLTSHGETLLTELMRRGMLIDIDHMGHKTTESALTIFEQNGYPVVSGHTSFRELKYGWRPSLPDPNATFSLTSNADDFGTHNVKRLSSEVDKTPDHLRRIRLLGGLVSPFAYQRDGHDCGYGAIIANDNAGSSKSFAQAYQYAYYHMHGKHVAFGTDANGAGQFPGPRFGPQAAAAIREEVDWRQRLNRSRPLRVDQVFAQSNGVRYSSPIVDYRHYRFPDYEGHPDHSPFGAEQRDFWEAIAMWRSGTPPELADEPPLVQRTPATENFIINLATGLRATSRAEIPISIPFPPAMPWPLFTENTEEQLAAYIVSHPGELVQPSDSARTQALVTELAPVWNHWQAMERGSPLQEPSTLSRLGPAPGGTGLYDANGNLNRSTAGRRDFDINIDGMAHYGLLPDLFQDMRNVGVQDMDALYRSAEDYIRVWERCESKRLP